MAVARVHVLSWQWAYRSLMPDEYLDSLRPEDRAARYDFSHADPRKPHTIVAEEDAGSIIAFATTMPSQDAEFAGCGELCGLYAHPAHWGRGVGVALVTAARRHLVDSGFERALLWVLDGNHRAERFYRLDGWRPDGHTREEVVWGIKVSDARFVRSLSVNKVEPVSRTGSNGSPDFLPE
jgi:GNAT superfamily N-acetyltransferase